jgi:hypothetical protein
MAPSLVLILLQGGLACQTGEAAPSRAEMRAEKESEIRWLTARLARAAADAERLPGSQSRPILEMHDLLVESLHGADTRQLELIADEVGKLEQEIEQAEHREAAWL